MAALWTLTVAVLALLVGRPAVYSLEAHTDSRAHNDTRAGAAFRPRRAQNKGASGDLYDKTFKWLEDGVPGDISYPWDQLRDIKCLDVNRRFGDSESTLLQTTVRSEAFSTDELTELLEALVTRGACVDDTDEEGNTALMEAVDRQEYQIIKQLTEGNKFVADPNIGIEHPVGGAWREEINHAREIIAQSKVVTDARGLYKGRVWKDQHKCMAWCTHSPQCRPKGCWESLNNELAKDGVNKLWCFPQNPGPEWDVCGVPVCPEQSDCATKTLECTTKKTTFEQLEAESQQTGDTSQICTTYEDYNRCFRELLPLCPANLHATINNLAKGKPPYDDSTSWHALCSGLAVSGVKGACTDGWTVDSCYKFFPQKKSWEDARRECGAHGAELVTSRTAVVNAFLVKLMEIENAVTPVHKSAVWLNARDGFDVPPGTAHDLNANWHWMGMTDPITWDNWKPDEPQSDKCMVMASDGLWDGVPCDTPASYICKRQGGECDGGLEALKQEDSDLASLDDGWTAFRGACYKLITDQTDWKSARVVCGYDESELATSRSPEVNAFLLGLAESEDVGSVWLNGHKNDDGTWRWMGRVDRVVNNKKPPYDSWAPGQPSHANQECMMLKSDGEWIDVQCHLKRMFFCKTIDLETATGHSPVYCDDDLPQLGRINQDPSGDQAAGADRLIPLTSLVTWVCTAAVCWTNWQ